MYFFTYRVVLYSKYLSFQNITSILLADAMQLPPPPPIFFHPVCICGWDNNPKSLCAFKLLKISKQNTVWQNIDSEVFLIFIEYTEPAAINKSKRLIKYLKTLNRTTKKRGLL